MTQAQISHNDMEIERLKKKIASLDREVEEAVLYLGCTSSLYAVATIPRPITCEKLDEIADNS